MPSFAEDLNTYCGLLFKSVEESYIPSEYIGLTDGMTGYNSQGQDAFALNPPIAGAWKDLRSESGINIELQPEGDRFILRGVIGYAMAASHINNPGHFTLKISTLINGMVGAAYKVYGPRVQKLTFGRPPHNDTYFRELENSAGYEIRLYGELSPPEFTFEMETVE